MSEVPEDRDLLICPRCLAVFRTGFRACPRDGDQLAPATSDPLLGTVLGERYQMEALLGEGGIGRVYRARHTRMSRRYAVKIPYGEVAYDPKVRARFANEAEAASRLSHPNVIAVVDFGETAAGLLYMAMDYAEGRPLASLIDETGPLDRAWVVRFTREIAEGLAHAHDRGLVHRDLKPDNIIIERDGDRPRIVDFGLAIFREDAAGRMTTEGTVLGTPHYMAPEQATGQEIDQRTDLFALGLIMYEMMAGVLPFDGTPVQVARKNLSVAVPMIATRVPGIEVDPTLEAVCHHLLAKRPDDRPPSAHAVIAMLQRLERGDTSTFRMDVQSPRMADTPQRVDTDSEPVERVVPPSGGGKPVSRGATPPVSAPVLVESVLDGELTPPPSSPPERPALPDLPELHELPAPVPSPIALPPAVVVVPPTNERSIRTDDLDALAIDRGDGRRRVLLVAGVLALLVVGAGVAWKLASSGGDTPAAAPPDAVAIAVTAPPDAATAPSPITVDAAAITPAAVVDAAPARRTPDARARDRRPDARPASARPDARTAVASPAPDARPVAKPVDAAPPPPPQRSVTDLYREVDELISQLETKKGAAAAKSFRNTWADIPYMDGQANPALRPDLITRLKTLRTRVNAALK
jgi:eukaryotic-like serine/threonine-protein kinase